MASILNEDLMNTNLDLPDGEIEITRATDPVYADAIEVHKRKKEETEKMLKEKEKEVKKMELSESLFEAYQDAPKTYDGIFRVIDNMEHIINYISKQTDEELNPNDMAQSLDILEEAVKEFRGYVYDLQHPEAAAKYSESLVEAIEYDEPLNFGYGQNPVLPLDFNSYIDELNREYDNTPAGERKPLSNSFRKLKHSLLDNKENLERFTAYWEERFPAAIDFIDAQLAKIPFNLEESVATVDAPVNRSKKFGDKQFSTDYIYRNKRDPLADIIQDELTSGESVYRLCDDGKIRPTFAPSLNLNYEDMGVSSDDRGDFIVINVSSEEDARRVEEVGRKYGKEVVIEPLKYVSGLTHKVKIYMDEEDWDVPYVDPNVKTLKDVKGN